MSDLTDTECWHSFLDNHKLDYNDPKLQELCVQLALRGRPKVRPHKARLESRRLVCLVAIEMGLDLTAIKHKGKIVMSRGLLDAWNLAYKEKYGSTLGTAGSKEVTRRNIKTKLSKQKDN